MDVMDVIADDVDYYSLRTSTIGSTPNLLQMMYISTVCIQVPSAQRQIYCSGCNGCYGRYGCYCRRCRLLQSAPKYRRLNAKFIVLDVMDVLDDLDPSAQRQT